MFIHNPPLGHLHERLMLHDAYRSSINNIATNSLITQQFRNSLLSFLLSLNYRLLGANLHEMQNENFFESSSFLKAELKCLLKVYHCNPSCHHK